MIAALFAKGIDVTSLGQIGIKTKNDLSALNAFLDSKEKQGLDQRVREKLGLIDGVAKLILPSGTTIFYRSSCADANGRLIKELRALEDQRPCRPEEVFNTHLSGLKTVSLTTGDFSLLA
ncbi:MAG: hypothetical protein HQ596_05110 [Candidatus Saganbacteria bacterium]|nr:hypothetical protein [Candidatus Saganbacteria bacterium]